MVCLVAGMGNAKANSYWEAELPPNYDRVGLENFIRAKYVSCKLWKFPFSFSMVLKKLDIWCLANFSY